MGIQNTGTTFFVPILALIMAGVSGAFSIVAIAVFRQKTSYLIALIAYCLAMLTTAALITFTGGTHSPFIALWLFVGAFAGLFGWWVWGAVFAAANAHVMYSVFTMGTDITAGSAIELLLIAELPLLASYLIWHNKTKVESGNDSALNELTEKLTQVADKSEIVVNSITDGVVAIDQNGMIQLINPAAQKILGWNKQDAMGLDYRSVIKLIEPAGTPIADTASPIKQVMITKKEATTNNLLLTTKSDKKISLSLVVSPVGEGKEATGAIAVFRDITEEKEQERQKAEFISTASHEMRTPVAAIEGYLGLCMNPQTATIDDKARLYLKKAYEATQHLGHLFQDLLTVSKAEDGRLSVRPAAIDMVAFTHEIVDSLQQRAKDKNIFLSFPQGNDGDSRAISPIYYARVDPNHVREVLNNLVDNAIKYTKEGGSATVDVGGTPDTVTINVTDTGIGIPPEDVGHLFQKFYRVDNSETREIGGTGLGLYLSRRLIEANDGHVSVTSVYGKGSTFTVQLPRISHEQAASEIDKPPQAQAV